MVFNFTFPNCENLPSIVLKSGNILQISRSIAVDLCDPIRNVVFGHTSASRAIMAMPKATMYEYHFAFARKDKIRLAR